VFPYRSTPGGLIMLPIIAIHTGLVRATPPPSKLSQVQQIVSSITTTPIWMDISPLHKNGFGSAFFRKFKESDLQKRTSLFHIPHEISLSRLSEFMQIPIETSPSLYVSLHVKVGQSATPAFVIPIKNTTISQIAWEVHDRLPPLSFFKAFSKRGIWNHVINANPGEKNTVVEVASLNPNILHSFEGTDNGAHRPVTFARGYVQVTPLPGFPLWRWVLHPVHRVTLLSMFGKEWLMRSMVEEPADRLYRTGTSLTYRYCPPDRLAAGRLDEICAMVAAGGTVATTHVRSNLKRAHLIGYAEENGVVVGNSSLKNPRPEYIETVYRQSGLNLTGYLERGYTSVRPEYRGLGMGTTLLEGLTQRAGDRKIFSVISEDNEATKIIAKRNRTRKVATYFSEKAGKQVGIWMPEWMIDQ